MSRYACIDAAGHYGSHARVWAVYAEPEQALGRAEEEPGLDALELAGAEVGDRVHANDVGRVYHRLHLYRVTGVIWHGKSESWVSRAWLVAGTGPDDASARAASRYRPREVSHVALAKSEVIP